MNKWQNYFMDLAERSSLMSYCERLKVGVVAVKENRPICSGWNGLPPGGDNCCEDEHGNTKPEVNHAERNLIEYAAREGISLKGSDLYVTHCPCLECAKSIRNVGIKTVYFKEFYRSSDGLNYLNKYGVIIKQLQK